MSKYDPLRNHLLRTGTDLTPMNFREIEEVLGFALPPSARRHRAWWSNSTSNGVMTDAWLAAGYKSEDVDMESERLVFRRTRGPAAPAPSGQTSPDQAPAAAMHSIFGILKGTVTLAPGTDLTEPNSETWRADA